MPLPHFTIAPPPPAPPAPATSTSTSSKIPTSSNNPGSSASATTDISSARTPPATVTTFAGSASYTSSPSPRTRLPDRDFISPGLRNPYPQGHQRPSRPPPPPPRQQQQQPQQPQQHSERFGTVTVPTAAEHNQSTFSPFPPDRLPPKVPTDSRPSQDLLESFNEPLLHGPATPDSTKGLKPPSHKRGHSRSGSSSSIGDRLRNFNRWSVSSASSKGSNGGGSSWRIGWDSGKEREDSPGQKSHKRRPSTSEISPRSVSHLRGRSDSPLRHPIPPLPSLPRISTGPSLVEAFRHQASEIGKQSPVPPRRYYLRPPPDGNAAFWDGAPQIPEDTPGSLPRSHQAAGLLPPAELAPDRMMPQYTQNGDPRGQSRGRSHGAKSSTDSTASNRHQDRQRHRSDKKAMLSEALSKANTAVQLDNGQDFEAARRAYTEACHLLQEVLQRTSVEVDRRKLEAIHQTYVGRIDELNEILGDSLDEKALPEEPESYDERGYMRGQAYNGEVSDDEPMLSTFTRERSRTREPSLSVQTQFRRQPPSGRPPAPPTLTLQTPGGSNGPTSYLSEQYSLQSSFSKARFEKAPMDNAYMPPPLLPRRPLSPAQPPPPPPAPEKDAPRQQVFRPDYSMSGAQATSRNYKTNGGHQRDPSHESISWLDPIEESGGSSASSVHSRSSSTGIRRKHIRAASGDTEAEFDAALDDAIEAAYDEGFEPEDQYYTDGHDAVTGSSYPRDQARDEGMDALELANERERKLRLQQHLEDEEYRKRGWTGHDDFYDEGHDSEEEERFLEEMTKGYQIEDFAFGPNNKQSIPRESDSSGVTNRTWNSSTGSNQNTSTTLLSTVSESPTHPEPKGPLPPLPPPPAGALPQLPDRPPGTSGSGASNRSVRQRRLSGQNLKQLKIETTKLAQPGPTTAGPAFPPQPARSHNYIAQQRQALSAGPDRNANPLAARRVVSPSMGEGGAPPLPAHLQDDYPPRAGSPSVGRPSLKKTFSSSSLRSAHRKLSVSHNDDVFDMSPGTPVSNQFGISGSTTRLPSIPSLPTPIAGSFRERADTVVGTAGMYLFDAEFHSANDPGSPNGTLADAPAPLEPCPSDVLLRPFWLMRCLYQTLCHPRGGYISNKLFVPRDVWRVKGVKLKYVEEKISQCDLMTAALQKLARVDTCDADAVLEEMQALETVIESVEKFLVKKLGAGEVGPHATSFKDPVHAEDGSLPRSASVSAKTSAFSWRRLRSKNSSANLTSAGKGSSSAGGTSGNVASTPIEGAGKDIICPSLPMTTHPTNRPMKRDVGNVLFQGPNANYMSSLARLFDAAQLVDQIARQVEDPGLRHADKTQVGLELSTRHAAEFFALYICRFVLSDLTLMLDKFLKRGSEWVLV
ncbi:hypothetical protein QR685DRAFT_448484 [Neurospora intermedia]|uniref:MIT domain-containing protein n=1 Tax=Neurospora intermedia TaxID=5142 RepID=A0ABR3D4K7_NEUIN